jgi:DsbC/DsbD-like thiol-disulfide interchange protein
MLRWLVSTSSAAILASVAPAHALPSTADEHARASIVSETDTFAPGRTAFIGIAFEIDDEWHLYWNGRNDTGYEPEINLNLPQGFELGQVLWPAPRRYISAGDILDHIYERHILLMIPVKVPADAKPGAEVTIEANVDWLVCKDACIPGSAHLTRTISIAAAGHEPQPSSAAAQFQAARRRLPKPLPTDNPPLSLAPGKAETFTIAAAEAGRIAFYPSRDSARLVNPIADAQADGKTLNLRLADADQPARIVGIVELWPDPKGNPNKSTVWWVDTAPPTSPEADAPPAGPNTGSPAPVSIH